MLSCGKSLKKEQLPLKAEQHISYSCCFVSQCPYLIFHFDPIVLHPCVCCGWGRRVKPVFYDEEVFCASPECLSNWSTSTKEIFTPPTLVYLFTPIMEDRFEYKCVKMWNTGNCDLTHNLQFLYLLFLTGSVRGSTHILHYCRSTPLQVQVLQWKITHGLTNLYWF